MKTLTLKKPSSKVGWPLPGARQSSTAGDLADSSVAPSPLGWPLGTGSKAAVADAAPLKQSPVSRETPSPAVPRSTVSSQRERPAVSRETQAEMPRAGLSPRTQEPRAEVDVVPSTFQNGMVQAPPETQPGPVSRETEPTSAASSVTESRSADGDSRERRSPTVTAARTRDLPRPREPRVITVANQKGGVGKTTTAVNMAAALSQSGLQVLVIDMDPQGNASTALGIDHGGDVDGIYDVLIDGTPLQEVVRESPSLPGLWCAPATVDLAGAEIELVPMVARESRLRRAVHAFLAEREAAGAPVDYVFIDCPPSLGLLTINSFVAGSEVLIPIQCEYYALEGLSQLLTNIDLIKEHLNPTLRVSHILLTMFDGRTRLSSQVADEVRSHFDTIVLRTSIPRSVRISEAPSHGETVITYDPISSGALCYLEAAKEVARAAETDDTATTQEGSNP